MKNLLGNMFRYLTVCLSVLFVLNFFAQSGTCYQAALITYPDYNKNWKQAYHGKQDGEVIAQWVPSFSDKNNWGESVVFHSYSYAKGNSCYKFLLNLLSSVESRNKTMKSQILKDNFEDSIAIWCVDKTPAMSAQCEIVRVTSSFESLVSIHYINKNKENFNSQQETWLNIIRNVRIYYSYYRWDRVLQKETSVEI